MVSSALAAALARRNIHYGWIVVAVTFLTMLVTAGAMGAPGVLIVPLEREFGWDNAQISTALALRLLLFGVFGPFAAAFMNRFGLRRVMICALALIVAGFVASLAMTHVWQLVLLWGVVVGVGTGLTAIVLAATVATRWFTQRRGPGGGPSLGEFGDRATGVPAADRGSDRALRLAHRARLCLRPAGGGCPRRAGADARPAERSQSAALRRERGAAAAAGRCRPHVTVDGAA